MIIALRRCFGNLFGRFLLNALLAVGALQSFEDLVRPVDNAFRHTRHLGHMDTETVLATAGNQLTKEDHFIAHLLDRDVVILDALEGAFHLVQLMIMSSEKGLGTGPWMLVDVFDNGPGDRDTVVGAGSTAQLVEKHKAP